MHGYQCNVVLGTQHKTLTSAEKLTLGNRAPQLQENNVQAVWTDKARLGERVHRQTLPILAQTWTAIFS